MSFPRAKLQRFNETQSCAPPPGTYDPKLPAYVKGAVIEKSERFTDPKTCGQSVEDVHNATFTGSHQQCIPVLPVFRTPQLPRKTLSRHPKTKYNDISSSSESSICSKDLSVSDRENDNRFQLLENKIKTLENEIEKLENRIIEMKAEQQDSAQKHEKETSEINEKYIKAMLDIDVKCSELGEIKTELNAKAQMVEKLEKQCDQLMETVANKENMLSQCTNDNKELEKQMEFLKNNTLLCNDLQQNLKSLEQMYFILQNENDRLKYVEQEKIAILTELSSVKDTKNELEMKLDQNREMILFLQSDKERFETAVEKLNIELNHLQRQMIEDEQDHMIEKGALEDKINKLSASLLVQDRTLTKLEEELKTSEIKLKKAEEEHLHQVNQLTSEYSKKAMNAQNSCNEKEIEVLALRNRVAQLEDDVNDRKHICDDLKVSVLNCQLTIVELQDKVDSLYVELNAAKQMVSEYREKLSRQEEECKTVKVEMASKVSEYSEKLSKKEKECKKLEVGTNNNYATIEALKTRLFESEYEVERLNKVSADLESQVLACQQQVKYLEIQIALQEKCMTKLKEENLAEIENVRSRLLSSVDDLKQHYAIKEKTMEETYKEKDQLIESLYIDLEDVRKKIEHVNECVAVLESDNDEYLKKLSEYELQISHLIEKLKSQTTLLNQDEIKISLLNDAIKMQDMEVCKAVEHLMLLNNNLQNKSNALAESLEMIDVLNGRVARRDVEIERMYKQLEYQVECNRVASEKICNLEYLESTYKKEIDDLLNKMNDLEIQVSEEVQYIAAIENQKLERETEMNAMYSEIKQKDQYISELRQLLNAEQDMVKLCTNQIDALEADKAVEEEKMMMLMSDLKLQTEYCASYQDSISTLQKCKIELDSKLEEKLDEITALSAQINGLKVVNDSLKEDISSIEISSARNECMIVTLNEQIYELENLKQNLQSEISKMALTLDTLNETLLKERFEMETYKSDLQKQREVEKLLQNTVQELNDKLTAYENQLHEQDKIISSLKANNKTDEEKHEMEIANCKMKKMSLEINSLKSALLQKEYEFSDMIETRQKEFYNILQEKEKEYSNIVFINEQLQEENKKMLISLHETEFKFNNAICDAELQLSLRTKECEQEAFEVVQTNIVQTMQAMFERISYFENLFQDILSREKKSAILYKKQEELLRTKVEKLEKVIHEKQEEHSRIVAELTGGMNDTWKKRCEEWEALVGPFRDQLTAYESERISLESRHTTTENCLKDLADKYANIIGHQNHKQKIKHMVMLKDQIFEQKDKLEALESTVASQKKTIDRLKNELSAATGGKKPCSPCNRPKGKENTERNLTASSTKPLRILGNSKK